jgi:Tol biopolymer transport system component
MAFASLTRDATSASRLMPATLAVALALGCAALAQPGTTERVSVSSNEDEANDASYRSSISADGRYVAFCSYASNLVPSDTNGKEDIFVRDCLMGSTERVSVSSTGQEADGDSWQQAISADGRFVVFSSAASDLVAGDTNGCLDVFVRDRWLMTTERVSVSTGGAEANSASYIPAISEDGRFIAFYTGASNLVAGDTNGQNDVFVRDRALGTTERVSVSTGGDEGNGGSLRPSISADGRFVAYESIASNLVPADTNGLKDVFVYDRLMGTNERLSISSAGDQGNDVSWVPAINADGRYVAFRSPATNLVGGDTNGCEDIFVRDRETGTTQLVSLSTGGQQGNGDSIDPVVSIEGRFVAFTSDASNLVAWDTNGVADVFVRDRVLGTAERVSIATNGIQGDADSQFASIGGDGRFVSFASASAELVPEDRNRVSDVFVHERDASYYTVAGTMTFQHLHPLAPPPSLVSVRVTWNGWLFGHYEADPEADGSYNLRLPAGQLTLSVKHTHWLRQTVPADNSSGHVGGIDFSFINGDATDDNWIDLVDLNQVLTLFGASDPMTDLDEAGTVDLPDLNVVLLNFGLVGDEQRRG